MTKDPRTGYFTLPGEAGHEDLTLALAQKWGADVIRDSDGTVLSDKIAATGFDIYSTLCLIRSDNDWAKANPDKLQQNFLISYPVIADQETVSIDLLAGYFREQFKINAQDDPKELWQVFDRTAGEEIPADRWDFDAARGVLSVRNAVKWHKYTVNFLVYRIWEEISMYNHITNNWGDRDHLMAIDPMYLETQAFILDYLGRWLKDHPRTNVVRFTSMFYNAAWFWGDEPNLRYIYADWGAYDFTVSPLALKEFARIKGYRLTAEDFVNQGLYNSTHLPPSARYLDWVDFINGFVVAFGAKCVDLVHQAGKKAYVFYDDQWIGVEPYGERFRDFHFDGIIKCVFNGFEARKCAGVKGVETHELRLHPYLFPTGLKGEPTFKAGGDPARDCRSYWINVRRALLRAPVDRIGLGGYLHLVRDYPDFIDYVEKLADEFRTLRELHLDDKPYTAPCKVGILTAWGGLRSWICSGHMTHGLDLNELIESLAGLPVEVVFLSFADLLRHGIPDDVDVIINCGRAGSAWSGGDHWTDPRIVERITEWVARGGGLIGVAEPAAVSHGGQYFQLAHILGVDREIGLSIAKAKYAYGKTEAGHFILHDLAEEIDFGKDVDEVFVLDGETKVLAERNGSPRIAAHLFHDGRGVYFSGHKFSPQNARLLCRAVFWAAGRESGFRRWTCSNINTECAYFPRHQKLAVINNSGKQEETDVFDAEEKRIEISLEPFGLSIVDM